MVFIGKRKVVYENNPKKLTAKLHLYQYNEQAESRKGYGTNDHLDTLKILIEKWIQYIKPLVFCS